jgi:hypothetical protein
MSKGEAGDGGDGEGRGRIEGLINGPENSQSVQQTS